MKTSFALILAVSLALSACAAAPSPELHEASNTRAPRDVVLAHLRAAEEGDWPAAEALLGDSYTMQMKGMPSWVSIGRANGLDMHRARKRAFPDFRFNEQVLAEEGNSVKIAVFLTGTHTGPLDYPIAEVPKVAATGRPINLPAEYFTYYVKNDRIIHTFGEIPEGSGPPALKQQLGLTSSP